MGQIVLGKHDGRGAEGVGLDNVRPGAEVSLMDGFDDVGPGQYQMFVAAFVLCAAEIIGAEVEGLDCRAHRAVNHEDALAQGGFQGFDAFL